jgi:hypothetical protein
MAGKKVCEVCRGEEWDSPLWGHYRAHVERGECDLARARGALRRAFAGWSEPYFQAIFERNFSPRGAGQPTARVLKG